MTSDIKSWKDLLTPTHKWEEAGYKEVSKDEIIGIPILIEDFEVFDSMYGQGVRILFRHPDSDMLSYFVTYGTVIVKVFANSGVEAHELIKRKIPVTFKTVPSQFGKNPYLIME